jgi:hypothetical protein
MKTIIPAHQASIYDAKHYKQDGVTPYTANDLSYPCQRNVTRRI